MAAIVGTTWGMDLRPATLDDLPDIARLHGANWCRDYGGILPEAVLGATLTAFMDHLWTAQALRDQRVFVARNGTALMGFAAMRLAGPHGCAFLENLHVAAVSRAQGVGRALMSAVVVSAMPGGLTLEVLVANTPARAIYRGWGGQESEPFEDRILGCNLPAVTVGWRDCRALADRLRGDTE